MRDGKTGYGKVTGSSQTNGESSAWATECECIGADRERVTPAVILTGQEFQAQWFPSEVSYHTFDCNPSG